MPDFAVGDEITTAGDGADDRPAVGELRQIVHHTGIPLATYEITAVWPPVAVGALWRMVGRITAVGDGSHSANGTAVDDGGEQIREGALYAG